MPPAEPPVDTDVIEDSRPLPPPDQPPASSDDCVALYALFAATPAELLAL